MILPSLPSSIPLFWRPQTCRGVVSSWGGLFHLTAQDLHEPPFLCASLWHMGSRNGRCYLCILQLLTWWLESTSEEVGRRSPQWDGTRSHTASLSKAWAQRTRVSRQEQEERAQVSCSVCCLLTPQVSSQHNKVVLSISSVSPSLLLVCGHHVLCVIVSLAQNLQWFPLLDTTRALDSLTLNPWNDLWTQWPLLMADFHLLIEISSFELMLNILIFQ